LKINMTCKTKLAIAVLALAPAVALGQEIELGQLLDQNAVKLTKADLEGLVPGTTTKFTQWTTGPLGQASVDYSWENPPGGAKFRVYARAPRTSNDGTGTWSISENGRYCWDIVITREWKSCRFIFKADGAYYMSPSADNRSAKAIPVKFEK
jgi:hypothetical protein